MTWTAEVLDRLRALCATKNYSNGMIAKMLNEEFKLSLTRNSVIGKRARDGLGGSAMISPRRKYARRKTIRLRPTPPSTDAPSPAVHQCNLMALTNETCRYPYGDVGHEGFFFCGMPEANLAEGRPYCHVHASIVVERLE